MPVVLVLSLETNVEAQLVESFWFGGLEPLCPGRLYASDGHVLIVHAT